MIEFPISGVETYWWLPAAVSMGIAIIMAPGGISGAFMLLPFQISVLGFAGPAVTPTNLIYNIVAIPSAVYHYWREKRMVWPLAWTLVIGTLPGIFIGVIIRIRYLPDPRSFKLFVGAVLLYIAFRLVVNIIESKHKTPEKSSVPDEFKVSSAKLNLNEISYLYNGEKFRARTWEIMLLCLIVGVVGGTYGIGGGAIIAPFLVTFFRFQVHSIAGATLFSTFVSSIAGVLFFTVIAPFYGSTDLAIMPDWYLGVSLGLGGMVGMYIGARLQRLFPAGLIKSIVAAALLLVSVKYILQFFL